jgi:hypothetical protein
MTDQSTMQNMPTTPVQSTTVADEAVEQATEQSAAPAEPINYIEDVKPIDPDIDLDKAYARVIESVGNAEKFRTQIAEPSLGLTYEQLWNEEEMVRYAVSTLQKKDANVSDYYDPLLYAAGKRIVDRVRNALFEGAGDSYYTVDPKNDEDKVDNLFAKKAKALLDVHLKKSKYKKWVKKLIYDGGFIDIAIGKMVPEKKTHKVYYRAKPKDLKPTPHNVVDSHISLVNIDIQNFYVENPYEPDLAKNNVTEVYESTVTAVKSLAEDEIYDPAQVKSVKGGVMQVGNVTDQFKHSRRDKLKETIADAVLIAEYWGFCETKSGEQELCNIVLAGDTIVRAVKLCYWHGEKPYIVFRWEDVTDCFYGFSMIRRWIRSQWVYNQAYNLDIRGSILRASGVGIAQAQVGSYLKKQMPNGKVKAGQTLLVQSSKPIGEVYQQMQFPDVHTAAEGIRSTVRYSVESGMQSNPVLSGQPTGTQLDRTSSGYGMAVNEALVPVRDVVYAAQDDVVAPSIEMFYQLLEEFVDEDTSVVVDGHTVNMSPSDIFGMVHITVTGGSNYLENERKSNNLLQAMEVVKGINGATEEIDLGEMLTMFLKSKGIDYDRVKKQKTPQQLFVELLQYLPPEQIMQLAQQAQGMKQKIAEEKQTGMAHKAKQDVINTYSVDKQYNQVVESIGKDSAAAQNQEDLQGA